MGVLSAGIRSLLRKTEGADLSRPAEAPDPGRDHPGMVGDIISERWARSSRNRWAGSSRNDGRLPPESAPPPPPIELMLKRLADDQAFFGAPPAFSDPAL